MRPEYIMTDGLHRQRNEVLMRASASAGNMQATDGYYCNTRQELIGSLAPGPSVSIVCPRLRTIVCRLNIQNQGAFHFLPYSSICLCYQNSHRSFRRRLRCWAMKRSSPSAVNQVESPNWRQLACVCFSAPMGEMCLNEIESCRI